MKIRQTVQSFILDHGRMD